MKQYRTLFQCHCIYVFHYRSIYLKKKHNLDVLRVWGIPLISNHRFLTHIILRIFWNRRGMLWSRRCIVWGFVTRSGWRGLHFLVTCFFLFYYFIIVYLHGECIRNIELQERPKTFFQRNLKMFLNLAQLTMYYGK